MLEAAIETGRCKVLRGTDCQSVLPPSLRRPRQRILANAQDKALARSEFALAIPTRSVSEGSADGNLADASGWYGPMSPQYQNPLAQPRPPVTCAALDKRANFLDSGNAGNDDVMS